jgi:hypothetical protein
MVPFLDINWSVWKQDALMAIQDIGVWIRRYASYLGQAQSYLQQKYPNATLLGVIEQQIANIDPNLNFANVSYGELLTDYNALHVDFVTWYGLFFGQDGLIGVNFVTIQDGVIPVDEWDFNVGALNGTGEDTFTVERPSIIPV